MAALTTIAVQNNRPDSVDLVLNGSSFTLNAYQVSQLLAVMQRVGGQCQNSLPTHTGATVSLPAGMAS
jgi:hypothetical protein